MTIQKNKSDAKTSSGDMPPITLESTQRQDLIDLSRRNPNVFIEFVLGYTQAGVHKRMQNHLSNHPIASVCTHRGCGKTDQISIGRCAWEIGKNKEIRIKVFKNTEDEARKVVDATRRVIESERYKMVFPNIKPDKERWAGDSFRVLRNSSHEKEPTYQSYGITGSPTGGRFDLGVFDDICDMKNTIQFPSLRERTKETVNNAIMPMRVAKGRIWRAYTPYHIDDITADWERSQYTATLREPVVDFVSPWPEEFPPDRLRQEREEIGDVAYARAYELKRISDSDVLIRAQWIINALYEDIARKSDCRYEKIASIDFAFTKKRQGGVKLASHDPDYSVCLIAYVETNTQNVFIDQMVRVQTTYPEFKKLVVDACSDCTIVLAEDAGEQRGFIDDINSTTPLRVRGMTVNEYMSGNAIDKKARLSFIAPMIEAGKLHIKAFKQQDRMNIYNSLLPLFNELTTFPVCDHDDTVDATTQLLRFVRRNHGKEINTKKYQYEELLGPSAKLGQYFN